MDEIKQLQWAEGQPDADGESRFWNVGQGIWDGTGGRGPAVTSITLQQDLPGLHCNMWRVCVWIGEHLAVEAPLHSLHAVGYPNPAPAA